MLDSKRRRPDNTKEQDIMGKCLFKYINELHYKSKRVKRTIIFRKVMEINLLFKGGTKHKDFFPQCIHGITMVLQDVSISPMSKFQVHLENYQLGGNPRFTI